MKTHNRKLLHDHEDAARSTGSSSTATTTTTTRSLQPSDPLLSNTNTTSTTKPFEPTLGFDSSMALTLLVLLTALFFMVFFSMYLRRFSEEGSSAIELSRRRRQQRRSTSASSSSSSMASSFSSCRKGLDSLTIKSLPLFAYDIGNSKEVEPLDCVVCLSDFEDKETVKMIPYCGHVFHQECIDTWLSSHVSCPLCRSTRLFRSSSVNQIIKNGDDDGLGQNNKRFDDHQVMVVVMLSDQVGPVDYRSSSSTVMNEDSFVERGRQGSTVVIDDTCVERESKEASSSRVRRARSWSRLLLGAADQREVSLLPRSWSF